MLLGAVKDLGYKYLYIGACTYVLVGTEGMCSDLLGLCRECVGTCKDCVGKCVTK